MFYPDRQPALRTSKHLLVAGLAFLAGALGIAQNGTAPNSRQSATVTSGASVEKKVRAIVAEQLGVDPKRVTPKARFVEDLGADGLSMLDLSETLERAFNVSIHKQDLRKMLTVQDAVDYVSNHAKGAK